MSTDMCLVIQQPTMNYTHCHYFSTVMDWLLKVLTNHSLHLLVITFIFQDRDLNTEHSMCHTISRRNIWHNVTVQRFCILMMGGGMYSRIIRIIMTKTQKRQCRIKLAIMINVCLISTIISIWAPSIKMFIASWYGNRTLSSIYKVFGTDIVTSETSTLYFLKI